MILSVVIVTWNVRDYLEKCLDSLISTNLPQIPRQAQDKFFSNEFEIFVVDNASTDGSVEMVREKFPQVHLIVNKENLGFAKANNQAIRKAKGEFILLLNPDTEFFSSNQGIPLRQLACLRRSEVLASRRQADRDNKGGALEKMVKFMEIHPDCGIVGCKLLNSDGSLQPSVRRFPTLLSQVITLTKAPNIFPWLIKKYLGLDIDYNKTQEVDQIMGSFFMIRRKVIEQIGLLDENFWAWFEEVDYCKRAKKAGWKIYYYPEVEVIHHKGQSFSQLVNRQRQFNKSLLYYFKKHHSFFAWFILWLMQPLSLFLTWLDETIGIKRRLGKKKFL